MAGRTCTLLLLTVFSIGLVPASPAHVAGCQFVLGFQVLHDLIPTTVGDCLDNEYYNPTNGDGLQQTTGGLLVWRKADNWTAFTDGNKTWINGPFGIESRFNVQRFYWEPDYAAAGANQTPGEIADASMGTVEKAACADVNINVTLTTPQQVACAAIRNWQSRPVPSAPIPEPTAAPATAPSDSLACPPMQTDQVGIGAGIEYHRGAYVPMGYGLFGNFTPYGSNQRVTFLIRDSNRAIVWSRQLVTGENFFIFEPKYSDYFQMVAINPSASTETIVLNWHVCQVPS